MKRESLFPIQSPEVVQLNMRGLRIMADIKQPISYHVARHTFTTTSVNLEIPSKIISKFLGHTGLQTTQVYAKIVDNVKERDEKVGQTLTIREFNEQYKYKKIA